MPFFWLSGCLSAALSPTVASSKTLRLEPAGAFFQPPRLTCPSLHTPPLVGKVNRLLTSRNALQGSGRHNFLATDVPHRRGHQNFGSISLLRRLHNGATPHQLRWSSPVPSSVGLFASPRSRRISNFPLLECRADSQREVYVPAETPTVRTSVGSATAEASPPATTPSGTPSRAIRGSRLCPSPFAAGSNLNHPGCVLTMSYNLQHVWDGAFGVVSLHLRWNDTVPKSRRASGFFHTPSITKVYSQIPPSSAFFVKNVHPIAAI